MFDEKKNPPPRNRLDKVIRRFNFGAYLIAIVVLYVVGASLIGFAIAPALWFLHVSVGWTTELNPWLRWPLTGFFGGLAYFMIGVGLMIMVPIYNRILPTRIKAFKGGYFTYAAVPWYLHNGLFYLVRYTYLWVVTPTPFGIWFLRAMGMKMGKRVYVNTESISDPMMITLGDDVVIGGSAYLFAHYGGGGHLVIAPVKIGDRATIGLKATVMGDVVVGNDATVLPHSVLLPGTRVGEGETWGGVPARRISREEMDRYKESVRGVAPARENARQESSRPATPPP